MAGRWTFLGFLHACTSQIISNETTLTFQGSIDENNTWISVKCLSRGSGLSGILFKNVKYSACLNPINQWDFFHLKRMIIFPMSLSRVHWFPHFKCAVFAICQAFNYTYAKKKRVWEPIAANKLGLETRKWLFKTTCKEEKISQQSSSHLTPAEKKTIETITEFLMVLMVIKEMYWF